jgi:hypothetical protein
MRAIGNAVAFPTTKKPAMVIGRNTKINPNELKSNESALCRDGAVYCLATKRVASILEATPSKPISSSSVGPACSSASTGASQIDSRSSVI